MCHISSGRYSDSTCTRLNFHSLLMASKSCYRHSYHVLFLEKRAWRCVRNVRKRPIRGVALHFLGFIRPIYRLYLSVTVVSASFVVSVCQVSGLSLYFLFVLFLSYISICKPRQKMIVLDKLSSIFFVFMGCL